MHTINEPYSARDQDHARSTAVREFTENLLSWGLIRPDSTRAGGYSTTERGVFLIDYIGNLPLPRCNWTMDKE